jgi:hypothetical protein
MEKSYSAQAFVPKGSLESVRPADPRVQAKWALDVYYSAIHSQMTDGGGNYPEFKAIWGADKPLPPLPFQPPDLTSSERPYDAAYKVRTLGDKKAYYIHKYQRKAKHLSDPRVLFCVSLVEPIMDDFPDTLFVYLATKYPRKGNYVPSLSDDRWWIDPARAFVESGVDRKLFRHFGDEGEKKIAKRLRNMEYALIDKLEAEIKIQQGTKLGESVVFSL